MFSCEICEIFKNTFLAEHLLATAFVIRFEKSTMYSPELTLLAEICSDVTKKIPESEL